METVPVRFVQSWRAVHSTFPYAYFFFFSLSLLFHSCLASVIVPCHASVQAVGTNWKGWRLFTRGVHRTVASNVPLPSTDLDVDLDFSSKVVHAFFHFHHPQSLSLPHLWEEEIIDFTSSIERKILSSSFFERDKEREYRSEKINIWKSTWKLMCWCEDKYAFKVFG